MAILKIRTFPDPILRQRADVINFDEVDTFELEEIVRAMHLALLQEPGGAALAANQVGIPLQIFVIKPSLAKGNSVNSVVINPKIERFGNIISTETEGCLSFPGARVQVARPKKITVTFRDEFGNLHAANLSGFISRVFQHEMDHLNGVLFIDHGGTMNIVEGENA